MFNKIQADLLTDARQHINAGVQNFICCAISIACDSDSSAKYDDRWSEAQELKEQIDFGLDGCSCLELWLFSQVGVYPEDLITSASETWKDYSFAGWQRAVSRQEFKELCRMARLAWIDRALERGSLA